MFPRTGPYTGTWCLYYTAYIYMPNYIKTHDYKMVILVYKNTAHDEKAILLVYKNRYINCQNFEVWCCAT